MDLQKFVYDFGFKVVNIKYHDPYQSIDRYDSYSKSYYTKPEMGATIELEIDQRRLEHMANYFEQCERLDKRDHAEFLLRKANPALQEAYDKYKMLLELYK